MTQPVQEPSQGRTDQGQAYHQRQLYRRPSPPVAAGGIAAIAVLTADTQSVNGLKTIVWETGIDQSPAGFVDLDSGTTFVEINGFGDTDIFWEAFVDVQFEGVNPRSHAYPTLSGTTTARILRFGYNDGYANFGGSAGLSMGAVGLLGNVSTCTSTWNVNNFSVGAQDFHARMTVVAWSSSLDF